MPLYGYRCRTCNAIGEHFCSRDAIPNPYGPCTTPDCDGEFRRTFDLHIAPVMQEHYNPSVDSTVSSMGEFKDKLKRASDDYFARTGIESRFVPADKDAIGATDEGLESTNAVRARQGLKPVSNLA